MSINQNANTSALPNFRNLGILLRILVIVDGMCLIVALLGAGGTSTLTDGLAAMEAIIANSVAAYDRRTV